MIIKNGLVWEESGSFLTKDLHIDSDTHRIAMDAADTTDDTIIDASGLYVIPGLVDIHITVLWDVISVTAARKDF